MKNTLLVLALPLFLVGCNTYNPAVDQTKVCVASGTDVSSQCKAGQKIAFVPKQFGSEQMPVIFAANNCDLRYQVVATKGAVTCIFTPNKNGRQAKDY